jgi:hypothetical protein
VILKQRGGLRKKRKSENPPPCVAPFSIGLVEIKDMNEKLIRDQQLSGLKTRFHLSSLASGIYTLRYRNGKGNIATKKIIKQ